MAGVTHRTGDPFTHATGKEPQTVPYLRGHSIDENQDHLTDIVTHNEDTPKESVPEGPF